MYGSLILGIFITIMHLYVCFDSAINCITYVRKRVLLIPVCDAILLQIIRDYFFIVVQKSQV